ncbi:MAG TPA: hypothetical protein VLQ45_28475 [Thermoanaerobaculia bacterium]|nr:hypothetical protein [Thermoanaerobaculia bacterium]
MHRSVRRSVLPCLVLVLLVTVVPPPALAAGHPSDQPAGALSRSVSALWEAIVARVVPSGWGEKLGPDIDPDGLTAGACPPGGCDLGPDIDPNG